MIPYEYNPGRYIFPPRPSAALMSNLLPHYEGKYLGQPKLNGDCIIIFMNGIETIIYDRHKKLYRKIKILDQIKKLYRETTVNGGKKNKWMVLVGEYMVKSQIGENGNVFNHKLVLHDILVFDGMHLQGQTFPQRIELLDKLYGKEDTELLEDGSGVMQFKFIYTTPITNVYRVKSFYDCLEAVWNDLVKIGGPRGMYEGLVCKSLTAPLEYGASATSMSHACCKFRKPTKNYNQ